jgi:hypothetical protein
MCCDYHDYRCINFCCFARFPTSVRKNNKPDYVRPEKLAWTADQLKLILDYDLGFFDKDVNRVEPVGEDPFAPKVLPMCPVWTQEELVGARGFEPPTLRSRIGC